MPSPHWQTGSRSKLAQRIPPGEKWTPLWTLVDGKRKTNWWCPVDGEYDIDWAIRALPGTGLLWIRVMRLPVDDVDNGTRWVGPLRLFQREHLYDGRNLMDKQGGIEGHGYRLEAKSDRGCYVDQVYFKLDPRG